MHVPKEKTPQSLRLHINKWPRLLLPARLHFFRLGKEMLNMDRDKESMALQQNKRQEFRFSQVVKAVNKERDLRERELSHESNQFKARLQKLIDKRKELNLDPLKTRELELLLGPGFRTKSRCRSPERKVSPMALPGFGVAGDSGSNMFVTSPRNSEQDIAMNNNDGEILMENAVERASASQKYIGCEEGIVVLEGHGNEKPIKRKDILTGVTKDAGIENSDVAGIGRNYSSQSHRTRARKISQYARREMELKSGCRDTRHLPPLRKTNSELHVKLDNVQQWLSDMDIEAKPFLRKPIACTKRHSTSS